MFYFIFSPQRSGTTIMAQYLAACTGGYLPPFGNNEGQMAPLIRQMMRDRPWREDAEIDWVHVKAIWLDLMEKAGHSDFVEASPPNMMRIEDIQKQFMPDMKGVICVSAPLRTIASNIRGMKKARQQTTSRSKLHARVAKYIKLIARQKANLATFGYPLVTYEAFCKDPSLLATAFGVAPLDPETLLRGKKNSRERKIKDMTDRNCGFLKPHELDHCLEGLAPHKDLLAFFGYQLATSGEAIRDAADKEEWAIGVKRRAEWDLALQSKDYRPE